MCAFFLQGARLNKSVWNKIPKHWIFVSALCRSGKLTLVCLELSEELKSFLSPRNGLVLLKPLYIKVVFLTGKKGKS